MNISAKTARRVSLGAILAIAAGAGMEVMDAYSHEGVSPVSQPVHLAESALSSPFGKANPFTVVEQLETTAAVGAPLSNAWVEAAKPQKEESKNPVEPWRAANAKENLQWVKDASVYGVQTYEYIRSAYGFLGDDFRNAHLVGLTPDQFASIMREHALYAAREMLQKILAEPTPGTPESVRLYNSFEITLLYAGIQPDGGAIRNGTYESVGITPEHIREMMADNYFISAQRSLAELRTLSQSSNVTFDDYIFEDYNRAYESVVTGIVSGTKEGRTEADIYAALGITAEQLEALRSLPSIKNTPDKNAPAPQ